ncbi:hypothetical protein C0431_12515 [bacterium]|nr:hypothetical protein [bacterium]
MSKLDGKINQSEIHVIHPPLFSKRQQLSLADVISHLETITQNAPLRSVEATDKTNEALASLRLHSGYHLILHELRKARPDSTEMKMVDPKESNKDLFMRHVRQAIDKGDQTLSVYIESPQLAESEMIVNPPLNLREKLAYYMTAYDDELRLKVNNDIRIRAFELAGPSSSGLGIEFE